METPSSEKPIIQTHEDLVEERKRLCKIVLELERSKKELKVKGKNIKKK